MENRLKKMADLKKVTRENQKLREEMIKLTWKNQASLAINDEIYLAELQAENQKQSEEVLALMKRNNALLRKQSELYEKAIEVEKSKEAYLSSQSIDARRSWRKVSESETRSRPQ
ncbi:Uncharacterized protein Rs2_01206 [Raphanus sativus]|uniref:Uncharacterized protein LOC108843508 n=1 Tax=Raphanus sativus TaxID=3726 RepID=A0A6J0MIC8_RAPSA|nr:uncharacterized protein LOC108843508 [Raphanus sativus]KAJ4915656.1 Uncharacterized protein Rs2_01206 [Raphanus sativus]